ncbi:MAG: MMPL family transporter [Candidatus Aminicenantes bacterium]|nr:MAG: MMPL family transporter [Candidatus Aminicenantes bacterium]
MNKLLQGITHFTTRRWKIILIITIIFTMAAGYLSGLLFQNLDATWVSLVPKKAPVLIEYKRIMKLFKTANPIIITVQGENYQGLQHTIETIALVLEKRKDLFRDVYYKNDIEFLKKYGLLITKTKDLTNIKRHLTDFNLVPFVKGINDTLESEYLGDESGLKKQEKNASFLIEGLYDFFSLFKTYGTGQEDESAVKRSACFFTTGPQYMISPDKKLGLIFAIPTVSINQVNETVELVNELDTILEKWGPKFPGIHLGQTGVHTITRDEMKSSEEDSMLVTRLAFIFILLLLIFSFRMKSAPVFGMLTLMAAITWCLGTSYLLIGSLNIVTAMAGAILVGLGIDYSIHIFAQYSEARASGHTPKESIAHTMKTSGRGIIIGAITTILAFATLSLVSFRVLLEMGIITALGVFYCLLASLFLLPALLMWRDTPSYQKLIKILTYALVIPLIWKSLENKIKNKEKKDKHLVPVNFKFLASFERKLNKIPLLTLLIILVLTVFFFFKAKGLTFTGDWKKVEAKGLKSLELNDEILDRFNMTVDTIVFVTNSLEEDQKYYQLLDKNPMIAYVDSISTYIPPLEEQEKRLEIIRQIVWVSKDFSQKEDVNLEKLSQEIHRFRQNMLEMRDLANIAGLDRLQKRCQRFLGRWTPANEKQSQPDFLQQLQQAAEQATSQPGLEKLQRLFYQEATQNFSAMLNPGNIHLQDLPGTIRRRLVSESGSQFLLAAYPIKYNWDNIDRNPFLINMQKTTQRRASGMLLFMKEVIDTAKRDGKKVTLYALLAILIFILIDFANIRATLFIMLNIFVSIIWMVGILVLLGQQLNFINVLAVPLIIGIGIDDSVHIMHRYKQTGKGGLSTVLSSTGRAIFLTSLTTMCGFGSMYFARFQGIQSFGAFLFIGVGICFLMSVILLPALIRIFPNIFKNKKAANETGTM